MKYLLLSLLLVGCNYTRSRDSIVTASNDVVSISVSSRMANAISSIRWNKREYLNISDNGRGMQSTIRTQDAGECFNPTEAGSNDDSGNDSSSTILNLVTYGTMLISTSTQMAYWLHPSDHITANCNLATRVVNATTVSNVTLNKIIALNAFGLPNVISLEKDMYIGDSVFQAKSGVEINTAYLASEFHSFYLYNVSSHSLSSISTLYSTPTNTSGNVGIVATEDGLWAMGEWWQNSNNNAIIGTTIMANGYDDGNALVNILDVVTFGEFPIGWQHWQLYLVLGTLDQVKNTLDVITQ